jgi:putative transposase
MNYPIRLLCSVFEVAFSAFYAWKRAESHLLSKTKIDLSIQVKSVFEEHRSRYGAIRISKELNERGIKIGRHQTQTLMKKQNLVAIQPKSFVPKTTNSAHNLGRSPNLLLDRQPVSRPNEIFVGDITYLPMSDGNWLYLATFQDMYSRKINGYLMG